MTRPARGGFKSGIHTALLLGVVVVLGGCGSAPPPAQQAAQNTLTPEEQTAGWQLLFDGTSYGGFEDPTAKNPPGDAWEIQDGCLKTRLKPRLAEDLLTKESYGDFEFAFDWRISPEGNSGVKYDIQQTVFFDESKLKKDAGSFEAMVGYEMEHHLSDRAKLAPGEKGFEYVIGMEYQIIDHVRHSDARLGMLYQVGGLYSMIAPTTLGAKPVGEFNHGRIVKRGDHVEHWLNGVKVVDASLDAPAIEEGLAKRWKGKAPVYELLTKRPRKLCPISLQHHGDEVWFRNLKIRPL